MTLLGDIISSGRKAVEAAGVELKGSSKRPIPVDTNLTVRFLDAQLKDTHAGDKMVTVRVETLTKPWVGVIFYINFNIGHHDAKVLARGLRDWEDFSIACGLPASATDFSQLQNRFCGAQVWGHEPSRDGKYINEKVGNWFVITDPDATVSAQAASFVDDDIPF